MRIYLTCSFFSDLDKWTNASYVPTEEDILHIRVKTTAISTFDFKVKNSSFSVIDVGGQKSLRQYWIPYFEEDLKAIIFVASLACYDQTLADEGFEDINRMEDSLALFRTICEHPTLQNKAIILFLNKMDLFEKKIKTSSIRKYVRISTCYLLLLTTQTWRQPKLTFESDS